jgi:hypothetical protein
MGDMILDTRYWILDVRCAHKNAFSILAFIEHPVSSIQYLFAKITAAELNRKPLIGMQRGS